jgi:hypothetical protein
MGYVNKTTGAATENPVVGSIKSDDSDNTLFVQFNPAIGVATPR